VSVGAAWYQSGDSWLHRLDPRPKLLFTACGTLVLVLLLSVYAILAFLLLANLVGLSAGIAPRRLFGIWRTLTPLLLIILVVQPLFSSGSGPPLVELWFLRITREGLALGFALALRLVSIAYCWYLLLMTTRQSDLVQGLVRLGLPVAWGLVLALALRYPGTLQGLYVTVREAQQARGLRLHGRGLLGNVRAQLPVLIAMLVASLRSIERLAMALESRGFGGPTRRGALHPLHMRPLDWLALVIVIGSAAAVLTARILLGFGARPLPPGG
jgi:energy-coupling factor transport system permease protein